MARTIDVRQALYGIMYDMDERLRKGGNPDADMIWLEVRVRKLIDSVEKIREYNGRRPGEKRAASTKYRVQHPRSIIKSAEQLRREEAC